MFVGELCAPEMVEHPFGATREGAVAIEDLKVAIKDVHGMAPDLTYTLEDWAVQTGLLDRLGQPTS